MLRVLLVEDNAHKKGKIESFLNEEIHDIQLESALSYSSGVKKLRSLDLDLAILDISLPTFDRTVKDNSGGQPKPYGGLELARKINHKKLNIKFLFISQHSTFSENPNLRNLEDIHREALSKYPDIYLGYVSYSGSKVTWKSQLLELINKL